MIGRMRKRMILQRKSTVLDSYGQEADSWTALGTVWAGVQPLTAKEYERASKMNANLTHKIILRYNSNLYPLTTDRLSMNGRAFEVVSIANIDELNWKLELMCTEVV